MNDEADTDETAYSAALDETLDICPELGLLKSLSKGFNISHFELDERIGEGEPLTLTVEQSAVGMSGAQLPSLEKQLQGPGHRLYREKTEHEGTITKEGTLIGKRMDRYTLVPLQGNEVNIPAIRVDWWNVERRRKETAVLPARLLNELARPQGDKDIAVVLEKGEATVSVLVWVISLAVAFMLGRFWPRIAPALRKDRAAAHPTWLSLSPPTCFASAATKAPGESRTDPVRPNTGGRDAECLRLLKPAAR